MTEKSKVEEIKDDQALSKDKKAEELKVQGKPKEEIKEEIGIASENLTAKDSNYSAQHVPDVKRDSFVAKPRMDTFGPAKNQKEPEELKNGLEYVIKHTKIHAAAFRDILLAVPFRLSPSFVEIVPLAYPPSQMDWKGFVDEGGRTIVRLINSHGANSLEFTEFRFLVLYHDLTVVDGKDYTFKKEEKIPILVPAEPAEPVSEHKDQSEEKV